MIKDIISFVLANQNYIIDFQKTPIILNAKDHIQAEAEFWHPELISFIFENEHVEIIDIAACLDLKPQKISDTSRILVGEYHNRMFGIIVDKVVEIINLNGEIETINFDGDHNINSSDNYLEISGKRFQFINIDRILNKNYLKHKMD